VPDAGDIAKDMGIAATDEFVILSGDGNAYTLAGNAEQNAASYEWLNGFPFDIAARNNNERRYRQGRDILYSEDLTIKATRIYYVSKTPVDHYMVLYDSNPANAPTSDTILKAFFGFGDFDRKLPLEASGISTGAPEGTYNKLLLRGFKYGLYNAVPTSPTAVFRPDTYGQFRDMLEPVIQTRFFEDAKVREGIYNDDGVTYSADLGASPVYVSFRSRASGDKVDPELTNSQNLSIFVTSSIPYFDGVTRDRLSILPDLEPDVTVDLSI